jgi:hypothetical protein
MLSGRMEFRFCSVALAVVLATYLFLGMMGLTDRENPYPRDAAYNLLSRGLLSGHLYVDKKVPPGLLKLSDPYDPVANKDFRIDTVYRLHDFSYYSGRLYLYFGVAPALLVFIPWHLLTGGWLPHWTAVALICACGVLVNLSLIRAIKVRYFPASPPWMSAVATLILGFGSYAPVLLSRADLWEIPIAFSYLSVSVALRCLLEALKPEPRRGPWLGACSAALGIAFASRPNALPIAAILFLPFYFPGTRNKIGNWVAALVPLVLCGAWVAVYNQERFGSPFDFGTGYVLQGVFRAGAVSSFSTGYFWTNVRLHLFQPAEWSSVFPFVNVPKDLIGPNAGGGEYMSGILLNAPILWASFVVPFFLVAKPAKRVLVFFSFAAGWVVLSSLLTLLFFAGANSRYQFEYAPGLALLASVGVMALESNLAACHRVLARWVWVSALIFSSVFTILCGIDRCVSDHNLSGYDRALRGDIPGAEREFNIARMLSPGNPFARLESGAILSATGKSAEALATFRALVQDYPDDTMAQFDLAHELSVEGRLDEAIEHYSAAHRLSPGDAKIEAALESALTARAGKSHP